MRQLRSRPAPAAGPLGSAVLGNVSNIAEARIEAGNATR